MKAIRIHKHGPEEVLQIEELDTPVPEPDEVLVKVHSSALNHLDIWVRKGLPGVPLPIIPGSDASGTIEELGSLVKHNGHWKTGQNVILIPFRSCGQCIYCSSGNENLCNRFRIPGEHLDGYQAEYVSIPSGYILPKPSILNFEEAAAFPLATLTAYHMLVRKIRLSPGEWILVYGASSGVGSAAVQLAKRYGSRVITTIGSESKQEKARELGPDHIINYSEQPVGKTVREITDGQGVDVVFEHTGSATWTESLKALKKGGKIITCGATTGPHVRIDLRALFIKHQQIIGSTMGTRQDLLKICRLMEDKKLTVYLDKIFPMTEIRQAHHYLEAEHDFGKVVVNL
jgi:NADPH:quinone reductase-like Zn-dependent oxidoreductase